MSKQRVKWGVVYVGVELEERCEQDIHIEAFHT